METLHDLHGIIASLVQKLLSLGKFACTPEGEALTKLKTNVGVNTRSLGDHNNIEMHGKGCRGEW